MKTTTLNQERGGILLVTMIFVMTIAAALVSYLAMVQHSDRLVTRAQAWNSSLALAESGIEEGVQALNSGVSFSAINRYINGGSYSVTYSNGYVTSVGTLKAPYTGGNISRTVRVLVEQTGLFMRGLAAKNNIQFNGNGVATDSWNSYNPLQSLNGQYDGFSGSNGDVASVQGVVNIGNHTIQGNLYLGPDATFTGSPANVTGTIYTDYNLNYPDVTLPTTDTNGNAIVWQTITASIVTNITSSPGTATNVTQTGWSTNITSKTQGNKTTYTTNIVAVYSTNYSQVTLYTTNVSPLQLNFTNNGYYIVNDSTTPIEVYPGVTAVMDLKSFNFNPSSLTIDGGTTDAGTAIMYVESGSFTLAGNSGGGAVNNRPINLQIYAMPAVTSVTLSGNSTFVGVVYAPEATLTLNGGGNNNNLIGAVVVNSVTLNGHYDFHYDTSLSASQNGGIVVASWQEL